MSLFDDNRLAPILDIDDAALWNNSWDDLFSLDLPPLQDTSPLKINPQETFDADLVSPSRLQHHDANESDNAGEKRHGHTIQRSTVPLAEVLNQEQAEPTPSSSQDWPFAGSPRKRRRLNHGIEWAGSLHLPQPLLSRAYEPQVPAIPPLLQGLHEPPPTAGLFPRITDKPSPTWPLQPGTLQMTARVNESQQDKITEKASHQEGPELGSLARLHLRPDHESFVVFQEGPEVQPAAVSVDVSDPPVVNTQPKSRSLRRSQAALSRVKWAEQESRDLLTGVQKHGAGSWKKILTDPEFTFHDRTPVDLKDHYRVCTLREKKANVKATQGKSISKSTANLDRCPHKDESTSSVQTRRPKVVDDDTRSEHAGFKRKTTRTGDDQHVPDSTPRRPRTVFTKTEDQALLQGFERHGNAWAKIRDDSDLSLSRRQPRDLRDRVRHKWPEKYKQPGLKGRSASDSDYYRKVKPDIGEKVQILPVPPHEASSNRPTASEGNSKKKCISTSLQAFTESMPRYIDPVETWKSTSGLA